MSLSPFPRRLSVFLVSLGENASAGLMGAVQSSNNEGRERRGDNYRMPKLPAVRATQYVEFQVACRRVSACGDARHSGYICIRGIECILVV